MSAARKPLTFEVDRSPPRPAQAVPRKQVGARIPDILYRQLKARAAMEGRAVGDLVERAVAEFLERAA